MSDSSSSNSDSKSDHEPIEVDRFEDVFSHHIAEIEQIWKQLNIARAVGANELTSKTGSRRRKLKYPIKLSAVQQLANRELQEMREIEDEGADAVAESVEKEAGVLLSFMGAMFIENLMIKTMYHLPQNKSLGFDSESLASADSSVFSNSHSIAPGDAPPTATLDSTKLTEPTSRLRPIELTITREDVRKALLRDENFDFLVQSGLAQPGLDSLDTSTDHSDVDAKDASSSENIHLGYWKIVERTFSALEKNTSVSDKSSSSTSSSSTSFTKTMTHHPEQLTSKVLMSLAPETDASHRRFTIFPDNEDLDRNAIEFTLTKTAQEGNETKAKLTGRLQLGHIDILGLEGADIDVSPSSVDTNGNPTHLNGPMNFSWTIQNELDENFPLAGRPTPAVGRGSVQVFDPYQAYLMFGSKWLAESSWGVLSLEITFELGDSGFCLHNHYLAIPIFVRIPEKLMQ